MNWQELSFDNLILEVKENFRLRLGLWLTLAILLTWVSLVWSDVNDDLHQSLRGLHQDSLVLQDIESAEVWADRYEESSKRLLSARNMLWSADSEGLAKAKLQSEMARMAGPVVGGSQSIKVGSSQPVAEIEGVVRLRARLGVLLTPDALYQLLESLEQSDHLIVVEQLSVKLVRGNWNVELMVSAYFSSEDWSS